MPDIQYNIRMIPRTYFSPLRLACILVVSWWLTMANVAGAYNITDQQAYRVADSLPVFTFTVPISASSRSIALPVWGTLGEPTQRQFGYRFFSETSQLAMAGGIGFILSDAPVVDNEYLLTPGQSATFTIVLIGIPTTDAAAQQISARLTSIPLYLGSDRVPAPYTAAELRNFVSDKVTVR